MVGYDIPYLGEDPGSNPVKAVLFGILFDFFNNNNNVFFTLYFAKHSKIYKNLTCNKFPRNPFLSVTSVFFFPNQRKLVLLIMHRTFMHLNIFKTKWNSKYEIHCGLQIYDSNESWPTVLV